MGDAKKPYECCDTCEDLKSKNRMLRTAIEDTKKQLDRTTNEMNILKTQYNTRMSRATAAVVGFDRIATNKR